MNQYFLVIWCNYRYFIFSTLFFVISSEWYVVVSFLYCISHLYFYFLAFQSSLLHSYSVYNCLYFLVPLIYSFDHSFLSYLIYISHIQNREIPVWQLRSISPWPQIFMNMLACSVYIKLATIVKNNKNINHNNCKVFTCNCWTLCTVFNFYRNLDKTTF